MATDSIVNQTDTELPNWSFSGFDDATLRVFGAAREEARRLKHHAIFTEHLLLAIARTTDLLERHGLDTKKIKSEIETKVPAGHAEVATDKLCFGPRAKYILGLALIEARQLRHPVVAREHVLLALLQDDGGIAGGILQEQGLKVDDFRSEVAKLREDLGRIQREVENSLRTQIQQTLPGKQS